jgi:hypothetical protein
MKMEKERVIVSLTTYSKRIGNIPVVLDTIFAQTVPPDLIVLNLAYDEVIPDDVKKYIESHPIEVNRVPDTKVYKKLIPTLKKYPQDSIISIDDDFLYPNNMIEDFLHIHKLYPDNPISGNDVVLYGMQCHCGCASLVKYCYLGNEIEHIDDEVMKHCPSDDLVYTYFSNRNNHPYIRTNELYFNNMQSYLEGDSYSNEVGGGTGITDTYDYLIKRFGKLEQNLILQYIPNADSYIVSVIDHVYRKGYGTQMFFMGYDQGVKEMQSSFPFRIGNLILLPLKWLMSIFNRSYGKHEQ